MRRATIRLSLSRETVRDLDNEEVRLVGGGATGSADTRFCLDTVFCNTIAVIHCVGFSTAGCGSC